MGQTILNSDPLLVVAPVGLRLLPHAGANLGGGAGPKLGLKLRLLPVVLGLALSDVPQVFCHRVRELDQLCTVTSLVLYLEGLSAAFSPRGISPATPCVETEPRLLKQMPWSHDSHMRVLV